MPIPALAEQARKLRVEQLNLGKDEGDEIAYPLMKVGHQVQKQVGPFLSSLDAG
jgi:hypothetical protein